MSYLSGIGRFRLPRPLAGDSQRGKVTVNVVPGPGLWASSTAPWWDSAIHFTIARPRPKPPSWREHDLPAR